MYFCACKIVLRYQKRNKSIYFICNYRVNSVNKVSTKYNAFWFLKISMINYVLIDENTLTNPLHYNKIYIY